MWRKNTKIPWEKPGNVCQSAAFPKIILVTSQVAAPAAVSGDFWTVLMTSHHKERKFYNFDDRTGHRPQSQAYKAMTIHGGPWTGPGLNLVGLAKARRWTQQLCVQSLAAPNLIPWEKPGNVCQSAAFPEIILVTSQAAAPAAVSRDLWTVLMTSHHEERKCYNF